MFAYCIFPLAVYYLDPLRTCNVKLYQIHKSSNISNEKKSVSFLKVVKQGELNQYIFQIIIYGGSSHI